MKEELVDLQRNNNYLPTTQGDLIGDSEVIIIAVPTPLNFSRKPDLSYLESATKLISQFASSGTLIVNESTSYPGTLRTFIKSKVESNNDKKFLFAAAPERVDPGNNEWNLENTPRVIAGLCDNATKMAFDFYSSFCKFIHIAPNVEVAEASKLFENTFRQVNIALVNEFSEICYKLGFSAQEALTAASTKPFGFMRFQPGIGVGGHCIPIDPSYLSYVADLYGADARFIKLANETNLNIHEKICARIEKILGGNLKGKKIQIAGISYKPNVADLRESPALLLIEELERLGASVTWCDPLVIEFEGVTSVPLSSDNDLGLIVTPHDELDFSIWKESSINVLDISSSSKEFGWPKFF
jgi:UDP-N-acetyl-D-glucosamine dehydrogenase